MALFEFLKLKKKDELNHAPEKQEIPAPGPKSDFEVPELPELPPMASELWQEKKTMPFLPPQIPEEIEISTKQYRHELPPAPSPKKPIFSFSKTEKKPQKEIPLPKPEFEEDFEEAKMQMPEFDFPAKPMMTKPLEDIDFEKKYLAGRTLNTEQPRFIRAQKYGKALEELNNVRKIIAETDGIMLRFTEAESKRTHLYGNWQKQMEDMQRKLMYVDKTLFKQ